MNTPSFITGSGNAHAKKKAETLYLELQGHFLDRSMYEINDALTSILAVCDVESKEFIPKIKHYIERVNETLRSIKSYQSAVNQGYTFNLNLVLQNILHVVEDHYRDKFTVCLNLSELKASAEVDQSRFEKILLYLLIQLIESSASDTKHFLIELRQKDQEGLLTITKDAALLPPSSVKDIEELMEGFNAKIQMTPVGSGLEIMIKIPLTFRPTESVKVTINKSLPELIRKVDKITLSANRRNGQPMRFAF